MIQSAALQSGAFDAYKAAYSRGTGGQSTTQASFASGGQPPQHAGQYHGQIGISNRSSPAHMQTGQQFQFSSAPSPRFPQQGVRPSASPPAGASPHEGHHQNLPMAAPPTSAGNQPQPDSTHGLSHAAPSPTAPQSPGTQNREQQRVTLLLEINNELLQEVDRLQLDGQGGASNPQQLQQQRNEGQPEKMASEQYVQVMRRIQANLSYLMPKAQPGPSKGPPGPAHMTPPPHMTALIPLYERLKSLFPEWPGLDARMAASSSSPRPNGPNSNGPTAHPAGAGSPP